MSQVQIKITVPVPYSVLENIFVTALEGGSNYWAYIPEKEKNTVRMFVTKEEEPCFAPALLKAVMQGASVAVHDAEEPDEVLGVITLRDMQKRLTNLADPKVGGEDAKFLWAEITEEGFDATSSDICFQYIVMGEVVFG